MLDAILGTGQYVLRNRLQSDLGVSPFTPQRYLQAMQHLPSDTQAILDVGCNTGLGGRVVRSQRPEAWLLGLDCVPERVEAARAVFDQVFEAQATSLPLRDRAVCGVLALELVEYLTPDDATRFLAESYRVLRPGGRLILISPNPNYVKLWLTCGSILNDPARVTAFSWRRMRQMACDQGFRVLLIKGTGRMSQFLGKSCPLMAMYGSYMLVAERPFPAAACGGDHA